jgi:ketosteroid isomerase-like protein
MPVRADRGDIDEIVADYTDDAVFITAHDVQRAGIHAWTT